MSSSAERMPDRELSELVARALSAPADAPVWDQAARQMILLVDEKAPTLHFGPRVLQEIREDGVGHLFEQVRAGKWNPMGGHFSGWAWRVLKNYGLQAARGMQSRHADLRYGSGNPPSQLAEAATQQTDSADKEEWSWRKASRHCRALLDDVAAGLQPPQGQVDYFAVFLLELRRATTASFAKALQVPVNQDVAEYAAQYLPWHSNERALCIRENHATLGEIWDALLDGLAEDEAVLDIRQLCPLISSLAPDPSAGLSVANMTKLSQRARRHVSNHMDPCQWEMWFGHWWPRRV